MSPLQFKIEYIDRKMFQSLNKQWHSRLPLAKNCWEGVFFGAVYLNVLFAVAWWSKPVARLFNGKGFYELRRLAIHSDAPKNTATRMLKIMAIILKKDMPDVWKLISYQDTEVHNGTIYKAAGWVATARSHVTKGEKGGWKTRGSNRINQSTADKIRWEKQIRPEPVITTTETTKRAESQLELFEV